jgi:HK97 family phage portal protein
MTFKVYRDNKEVKAPLWIRKPDPTRTQQQFFEETLVSRLLNGNAYWLKTFNDDGNLTILEVLNPLDVEIETDRRGRVVKYTYQGYDYDPSRIVHLKGLPLAGQAKGLGPIQAAQGELRGAIDTANYGSTYFRDAGVPNGLLKTDQTLQPDQAKAAKDQWNSTAGAKNGVAVLGKGFDWVNTYIKPADAQFIEVQKHNVTRVAALFGIPSSLMLASVEGTSLTYQNVEQEWLGFIRFALAEYLSEIEQAITEMLPSTQVAKFNYDSLLRTDTKSRYEAHAIALENGFMTINEVRALENLPPLEEANNEGTQDE